MSSSQTCRCKEGGKTVISDGRRLKMHQVSLGGAARLKPTLPKYLSSSSTYLWMISRVMSSLSCSSMAQQKYRLAYLQTEQSRGQSVKLLLWLFNALLSLGKGLPVLAGLLAKRAERALPCY